MTSRLRSPRHYALATSGLLALLPTCLSANPTGGAVAGGSATIAGQGTGAVIIHQTSPTAIINWQTFSINSGESTSFLQPGANSAALNRVLGGQTSFINGTLSANGQVYLINGNGIIVGPGGVINASAFTASTRDITNADFLSGHLHFTGSSDAGVQNLGSITALGGNVALIGRTVDNEGTITAPKGTAGLIAANDVLLAQNNADGSTITVSPSSVGTRASGKTGVKNGGVITAAAAELKAANGNIYGLAVQNLGTIRATTVSHQGGHIWLTSDSGKVNNSGMLDASATAVGGKGGTVTVKSTTGAVSHTGQIVAKGGQGGVGGNAEISGGQVQFTGTVDLTAPHGTTGNLLIDPTDVDIVAGGGTDLSAATIDPSAIVSALDGANVTISASNSITLSDILNASGNANPGNLVLDAPTLQLNQAILLNGTLSGTASQVFLGASAPVQNGIDAIASGGQLNLTPGASYGLATQLLINKNITLFGNGATLNGQGNTRIMEIDGGNVLLDNLVFTGGNGAGSTGTSGSGNSGYGGALMVYTQNSSASVSITNSTFVSNSASGGAAIMNVSISGGGNSVFIEDSTFTSNSAVNGSVLYAEAGFGGSASFALKEDTISGNSGTGAIYSTVISSGTASLSVNDTILAGNTDFSGESDYVDGGGSTLFDNGYNLYGQNGVAGGFVPSGPGDILLNGSITNELGPLGLYGGMTPTLPLLQTSLSLESGDPGFIGAPDQRGVFRGTPGQFTGTSSDIGAFEGQYISVQANNATNIYGGTPVFSYTIISGPGGPALVSGTPDLVTPETNVGVYGEDIGQGTVMAAPGYILDFTNGDLTITQRDVTVLPDAGQGKIYGTPDPVLTYTTNPANAVSGLVNGDTLSGAPDYLASGTYTSVGMYGTTLGTLANSNYNIILSSAAPAFAITPRTVTVEPDPGQTKTYGSPDPTLTYTTAAADTTTGLVNGDTLTGALGQLGTGPTAPVGNYPFIPGTLGNPNYLVMIDSAAPSFTITPRSAIVTVVDGQSKTYGNPDPPLAYNVSGLINGDTLSGVASYDGANQFTGVGTYPTNLGTLGNPNYVLTLGSTSTFTINPATLYYAADQVQVPAGGTEFPNFTGTVVGFVGEDSQANSTTGTLVFSTTATPSSPQGYYEIDGSGLTSSSANYVFGGQAATNIAALIIGNPPPRGTMPPGSTTMPTTPAEVQTAASTPNTPTSQAIAQTTPAPTPPPQSGTANPAVAATASTTPPPTPPPTPADINVSSISPNESIDSTPAPSSSGGGGDSQTSSSAETAPTVAQSSSFNPDIGATAVTPGQSVTVGGSPGVPPPPVVQAQLNQILGTGALDSLSGALAALTTADVAEVPSGNSSSGSTGASGSSTSTDSSTTSSTSTTPGPDSQSASAAAVAAAASQPNAYANGPIVIGPSAMIAPGQTVTLGGGRASAGPPPAQVQTAFNQGFSPDSRDSLAKAAGL